MRNAFRIAGRELRSGMEGFRVFLACLALGVAAIAAVGSVASSLTTGLAEDGAVILGGDAALRMAHRDITPKQRNWLNRSAEVSRVLYLRSMAHADDSGRRVLVEMKMVDDAYPLYGTLEIRPTNSNKNLFDKRDGVWGAVIDTALLGRLKIKLGERIRIGDTAYEIRGTILREPDRISGARAIQLGPRFIGPAASIEESGLIRPGSLVWYFYRIRLTGDTSLKAWKKSLSGAFPEAPWTVQDRTNASPVIKLFIDRSTLLLTLIGLTTLLIGGVGISNAVRDFLSKKVQTIATLKCVGASSDLIFRIYLVQVMSMATIGIGIGLLLGALIPVAIADLLSSVLPIASRIDLYWKPLALAASFGILTALSFSVWPIARACEVPAATLFRGASGRFRGMPRMPFVIVTAILLASLAIIAIETAHSRIISIWFVGGTIAAVLLFTVASALVARCAKLAGHVGGPGVRLALANMHRPGAPMGNIVLSLGLGLTVLVTVALTETNLDAQITKSLPKSAPGYFFIDIHNNQTDKFREIAQKFPGFRELRLTPMLRGRVIRLNGAAANPENVAENGRWILRGDRGITWAGALPKNETVIAGSWWPADYSGPPLVSVAVNTARVLRLSIGDTITFNILGRKVTGTIANLRDVSWGTLRMNFIFIFSPGPLNGAPQTHVATVRTEWAEGIDIGQTISEAFPNVTTVRVRDVLLTVNEFLSKLGLALRLTAGIAIIAGTLVLAGSILGGQRRRLHDSVVLKVLGATRRRVLGIQILEFALLGVVTALIASVFGSIAAWAVVTQVMRLQFAFDPVTVVVTTIIATGLSATLGLSGTWYILGQKAAGILRNE
ncbi:MAG: FtsX-like permease family protein [Pseudomonadota bacterium]|nr:FtsX-like permease family protein [Pseudomonadota bacterium]